MNPADRPAEAARVTSPPRARLLPVLVVASAAAIGLPEGSIGVLWPSISAELGVPLDRLGLLLYAATGGYLIVAFSHGRLVRRFGTAAVLSVAAALGVLGASMFAGAPGFGLVVVGYFVVGVAAGGLDTGLNGYVSVHHSRLLSFMHGGFGIGAAFGPWAVTRMRDAGISWRYALVSLAIYEGLLCLCFVASRRAFAGRSRVESPTSTLADELADADLPLTGERLVVDRENGPNRAGAHPTPATSGTTRRPRLLLGLTIASFFFYVGVEAGIGAWGYTLLTGRGVDATTAGYAISAYFLAIMGGRFILGGIGRRVTPRQVLSAAIASALVCTLALWLLGGAVPSSGPVVLVLLGLSLAGIFPSLVALTPERLGADRTTSVIGWQLAGASLGLSTIPALMGVIAGRIGTASLAPAVFATTIAVALVHVVTVGVERADAVLPG